MMHVVVGANGSIGQAVMSELESRGIPVKGAGRNPKGGWLKIDATVHDDCIAGLAGASHVYVCLGMAYKTDVWKRDWPHAMSNLLDGAEKAGAKLIFLDNIYMYGPAPLESPITEDHPLDPDSEKGKVRKAVAEQVLQAHTQSRTQTLIARAPDFYGPNCVHSILYPTVIEPMLKGKAAQWIGELDCKHSFGYTVDIAKSMVELALADDCYGQVWHTPTKNPPLTVKDLHEMIAPEIGLSDKIHERSSLLLNTLGMVVPMLGEIKSVAYQYYNDYIFSSRKFEARFPQFAITGYEEGIRDMVRSFRPTKS